MFMIFCPKTKKRQVMTYEGIMIIKDQGYQLELPINKCVPII